MPLLRVALRLILGVNIRLHHKSRWTRMVWTLFEEPSISSTRRSFSKTTQPQFSGDPIGPNPLSLSPPARLAEAIRSQPVRTKQPRALLIDGADRLLIRDRRPKSGGTFP